MAKNSSARLVVWIAAIGLLILVAISVAGFLLYRQGSDVMASGEPVWLRVRIAGEVAEAPGNEGLIMDPADMPPLLTEVTAAIRAAAEDEDIAGLYLDVEPTSMGWGQVSEMRDAIQTFREAGKPCVAWAESYDNLSYMMAAACDDIRLAPAGLSRVMGLHVTQTYFAGTFEKLGIRANFEHVGEFKSAVEPYERTGPSEAAAEATNVLLDALFEQLVDAVADSRGLEPEAARALIEDPPMTPRDALDRGLVDSLVYRDEVEEELDETIKLSEYLGELRHDWRKGKQTIAVIYAEGVIASGKSSQDLFGARTIGDRTFRKQFEKAREDEDIKAIVLRVNSPGGSGTASDAMWRAIVQTVEEKPVVVSMANYAASGGYYIATAGSHVVADRGTLTGSIGVFGGKLNIDGLYEKIGLSTHSYERGSMAGMWSPNHDFDEEERERYRSFLQDFYQIFLERVAEGRDMEVEAVHEVARGRVWTGAQALERGLVDELGGLETAIAKAQELAEIEGDFGIKRIPERKGFLDQLLEELQNPEQDLTTQLPWLDAESRRALAHAIVLDRILADGAAALMPSPLQIQ